MLVTGPDDYSLRRKSRWAPTAGLVVAALWVPMALIIPVLPDLSSPRATTDFFDEHADLLRIVILSLSVSYLPLLAFLGALLDRLRREAGEGPLAWVMILGALLFMTALNVALGLAGAGALVYDSVGAEGAYLLYTAGFVLAAPAAFAGVAFFAALALLCFAGAFTRWLAWLAVVGALANIGAVAGVFSLSGPLNSGNGLVAGIALPLGLWLTWIVAASVWWWRDTSPVVPRRP